MDPQYFVPGDRVTTRRKLKPFRADGVVIPACAAGTITFAYSGSAFVQFDGFDHAVNVRLGDLDLLSLDEQFTLSIGYWTTGGNDAAPSA